VGGGKSSLAERLKALIEKVPFYAIKGSPVHESPLACSADETAHPGGGLRHPRRYLNTIMSPWAVKRLHEFGGDISRSAWSSCGRRCCADRRRQDRAGRREQPGHLVAGGQGRHPQARALFRRTTGRLQLLRRPVPGQPGLLEFVEMFKAPIKVLHPLLTATQEATTRAPRALARSFDGIVLAHSNESEWKAFKNNRNNEAFLDRIYIVKVPYCLRVPTMKIYEKLLANSSLAQAPCAPDTLKMMAQFAVLSRLKEPENSSLFSKMRVRRREPQGHRSQGQELPGVPRLRRRRRGHDGHVHPLCLQDPVQGVQLRPPEWPPTRCT
jgi:serine protein kinase